MSERNRGDLVPYHIIHGENAEHPQAIEGDIAGLLAAARHDKPPIFEMVQSMEESHAILHMFSVGVLTRLNELGAVEAERVLVDLIEEVEGESFITHNLSTLASKYDTWRMEATDETADELKKLTTFSYAAYAIAALAALHSRERDDSVEESKKLLPSAIEAVKVAPTNLSPGSRQALELLLEEVRADIK